MKYIIIYSDGLVNGQSTPFTEAQYAAANAGACSLVDVLAGTIYTGGRGWHAIPLS